MATNPGTTGLVTWWSLDETSGTRVDSHGSNDLTDVNTVGSAAAKQSNGADFERSNDEHFTLSPSISIADDVAWSVGGWVNFENVGASGQTFYSNAFTPSNYTRFFWKQTDTTVYLKNDANGSVTGWSWSPSISTWYFLTIVCDGTDTNNIDFYIDGVSQGAQTLADSSQTITRIGTLPFAGFEADGIFDEWFVYDGKALSADEISWLRNSGSGRAHSELTAAAGLTQPLSGPFERKLAGLVG